MAKTFKLLTKSFGFGVPNNPLVEHVNPLFFEKVLQRCHLSGKILFRRKSLTLV